MNNTRRKFFKQSLAGALLLGTSAMSHAEEKSRIIPKAPKSVNPFQLGMAGYTFVNFDLDTTLRTMRDWMSIICVSRISICLWIVRTNRSRLSMPVVPNSALPVMPWDQFT